MTQTTQTTVVKYVRIILNGHEPLASRILVARADQKLLCELEALVGSLSPDDAVEVMAIDAEGEATEAHTIHSIYGPSQTLLAYGVCDTLDEAFQEEL